MKVTELFEASKAAAVQVKNKAGIFKRFKSLDAPGAQDWARSYDDPAKDKANAKQAKADAKPKKISDDEIMGHVDDALASAMDGVDPMDTIGRWLQKNNIDHDKVDAVVNKREKIKGGMYAYIARSWGDMQRDLMSDAERELKAGKTPRGTNSQFFKVKDGKVVAADNPWGSEK